MTPNTTLPPVHRTDHFDVFYQLRSDSWKVYLVELKQVLPAEWNSKGAAIAGAVTELRRLDRPKLECIKSQEESKP